MFGGQTKNHVLIELSKTCWRCLMQGAFLIFTNLISLKGFVECFFKWMSCFSISKSSKRSYIKFTETQRTQLTWLSSMCKSRHDFTCLLIRRDKWSVGCWIKLEKRARLELIWLSDYQIAGLTIKQHVVDSTWAMTVCLINLDSNQQLTAQKVVCKSN